MFLRLCRFYSAYVSLQWRRSCDTKQHQTEQAAMQEKLSTAEDRAKVAEQLAAVLQDQKVTLLAACQPTLTWVRASIQVSTHCNASCHMHLRQRSAPAGRQLVQTAVVQSVGLICRPCLVQLLDKPLRKYHLALLRNGICV